MREYLAFENLRRAAPLAAVVTVMALPRLVHAGDRIGLRAAGCLLGMTFVAAAVTAWGTKAGLRGPWRGVRETIMGLGVAMLLSLILLPVQHLVVHPLFEKAVRSSGDARWIGLQLPATIGAWLSLALWSAGFQTFFPVAAPTCLSARLTGRVWPAIVVTAALGGFVVLRQLDAYHVEMSRGLLVAASAAKGLLACIVYIRFGLVPTAALMVGFSLHLLWKVL